MGSPLVLSLRSAALAVALLTPLALAAALLVRRWHGHRRSLADLLLLSPLVLPPTVLGFLLLQLLGPAGPLGSPLRRLGMEVVFHWSATVISAAVVAFPLMYRSLLAALDQVDPALEAVALGLGADPLRVLRRVTLPLLRPGLVAGLSLSFARALGEFGTTLMLAGNIPGRTQTLPLAIHAAVENGETPLAWRLTAVVLLLNGACLALVELGQGSPPRRRTPPGPPDGSVPEQEPEFSADPLAQQPLRPLEIGDGAGHEAAPAAPDRNGASWMKVEINLSRGDFSLQARWSSQARRLAVLGSSGAGKSLLLRAIAGLERPASGRVVLGARVLFDGERGIWVPPHRRRIAMVFQHHALFPHLSVAENVGFGLHRLPPALRRERLGSLLAAVGLGGCGARMPRELSGGQRQRVALARALAVEPDLLLLDEPLSSQDSFRRRRLQQLIDDLQRSTGIPMLLVTHDMEEAHRLSDELLVIDRGRLLCHAPTPALFRQPGQLQVARLTGCKNLSPLRWTGPTHCLAQHWGLELDLPASTADTTVDRAADTAARWIGLRANHLELAPAGATAPSAERIVRPCRLVRLSQGALSVSAYVRLHPRRHPLQVELRAREWERLSRRGRELELLIHRQDILWLRA